MEIENKRVVVTGGASGIGKALCEAFQASGAKSIVVVDMNYEDAKKTADSTGGLAIKANVAVEEDIQNLGILGDATEPLLATTLNLISDTGKFKIPKAKLTKKFLVKDPEMMKKQKMFVEKKLLFYSR